MNRVFLFRSGVTAISGYVAIPENNIQYAQMSDSDESHFIVNGVIVSGDFQAFIEMLGTPTIVPQAPRG